MLCYYVPAYRQLCQIVNINYKLFLLFIILLTVDLIFSNIIRHLRLQTQRILIW